MAAASRAAIQADKGMLKLPTGICIDTTRNLLYVADYDASAVVVISLPSYRAVAKVALKPLLAPLLLPETLQPMKVALVHTAVPGSSDVATLLYVLCNEREEKRTLLMILRCDGKPEDPAPVIVPLGCIVPPPGRQMLRVVAADYSDVFVVLTPPTREGNLWMAVYSAGSLFAKREFETTTPYRPDRGLGVQYDAELDLIRTVDQATGTVYEVYTYGGAVGEPWRTGLRCVSTLSTTYGRLIFYTFDGTVYVHESSGARNLITTVESPAASGRVNPNSVAFNPATNELIFTGKTAAGNGCLAVTVIPR